MGQSIKLPFISPVAGISNYATEAQFAVEGDPVKITHEASNPYDANACVVEVKGRKVGYLPKVLAARLAASGAEQWHGEVEEVLTRDPFAVAGLRVRVKAAVNSEENTDAVLTYEAPGLVKSRSGRTLGTFVRLKSDSVLVRTHSGLEVSYPKELVVLL